MRFAWYVTVLVLAASVSVARAEGECQVNDPRTAVCAFDETTADGSCAAQNGGSEFSGTVVHARSADARFAATIIGYESCYDFGTFGSNSSGLIVTAHAAGGFVLFAWSEDEFHDEFGEGEICSVFLYEDLLLGEFHFFDCPAAPPNPGWGALVP